MKEYNFYWDENIKDEDGNLMFINLRSTTISAENPDAALKKWDAQYNTDELNPVDPEDIFCVVKHELFKSGIVSIMPNGYTYCIPVETIARNRSKQMTSGDPDEIAEHMLSDTIPLFLTDKKQIINWAKQIPWLDIENNRHVIKKPQKVSMNDLQAFWINNEVKIDSITK